MTEHIFVGFGFGPIQGGLFAKEAFQSGNFSRIVIAEIDQQLVDAIRANHGSYFVNVARSDKIESMQIDNIELLNPNVAEDNKILLDVLSQATEIVTSLPSVDFYNTGGDSSPAFLVGRGLENHRADGVVIYTAENNNHAAEIFERIVTEKGVPIRKQKTQFLNTVIGKMSQVVTSVGEIARLKLNPIAPGIKKAFLVEEFNRILVSRTRIAGFSPGIEVFAEKDDLLPFEEAKLYGHNAIHALLGYIGAMKEYRKMTELAKNREIMQVARDAFLHESGAALIAKYAHLGDELFTSGGYWNYAEDLLDRMTNPYLMDTVERAGRDPLRKLAYNDRIFGTMALALDYGIEPLNIGVGALAGVAVLLGGADENNVPEKLRAVPWYKLDKPDMASVFDWIWKGGGGIHAERIIEIVRNSRDRLEGLSNIGLDR